MIRKHFSVIFFTAVLILLAGIMQGCGPRPPIPYQQLQVQDAEESRGYDIYMYVAVSKGLSAGEVESLLEWFRDEKFPEQNRIRIFVWDNPQAALLMAQGDLIATLAVDREAGTDKIELHVVRH